MTDRSRHDSLEKRLAKLEREDPAVAKAAQQYREMVLNLTGGGGLSRSELARLYDVSQPVPEELLVETPDGKSFHQPPHPGRPQDESPGQS